MGHCYHHALSSVKKWGGMAEDYLPLHQLVRRVEGRSPPTFGTARCAIMPRASSCWSASSARPSRISTGRVVPVRLIGEQHVIEDLGFIPSFADWVTLHPARTVDGPGPSARGRSRGATRGAACHGGRVMYGTYLRLDITVHDGWRAVVRAASRKLNRQALRDPNRRSARKEFYRQMLDYHRQAQAIVETWRL